MGASLFMLVNKLIFFNFFELFLNIFFLKSFDFEGKERIAMFVVYMLIHVFEIISNNINKSVFMVVNILIDLFRYSLRFLFK